MEFIFSQNRFQKILTQKDIYLKLLIGAMVLNGLQLIDRMMVKDKVILVPPTLSQDVWVMGGLTSKSFIEEWALYLSTTLLNVTSQTAAFHHKIVLRYVHPSAIGNIQKKLSKDLMHMKENNISTLFKPKSVVVSQQGSKGRATIAGNLSTFVGSKCIEDVEKTYILEFETSKNTPQLSLVSFSRLKDKDEPEQDIYDNSGTTEEQQWNNTGTTEEQQNN